MKILLTVAAALVIGMLSIGEALAAQPSNDERTNAPTIVVPQTVTGTTVEATQDDSVSFGCTGGTKASVWYRVKGTGGVIAVGIDADGDLDAAIAAVSYNRSQPTALDCATTDSRGIGVVAFSTKKGSYYYVRVAERQNSVSGTFTLRFLAASPDARKPGRRLRSSGNLDSVNLAANPSDAWSVTMHAGTPYAFNLVQSGDDGCLTARLVAPGQSITEGRSFLSCGESRIFTPGVDTGGRYTIVVRAATRTLSTVRYRLSGGRAGLDDVAPGLFWQGGPRRGSLNGSGRDFHDLYNFDLDRRASVSVRVKSRADFDVLLYSIGGRSLACSCNGPINRRLAPGTYFAAVDAGPGARGRYTLKRTIRAITRTYVTFGGSRYQLASRGQTVSLAATVEPASRGRLELVLEQKDPVYGWMFMRRYRGSGSGTSIGFTPRGVGEYRAKAVFKGSRSANPSRSGWARLSVRR